MIHLGHFVKSDIRSQHLERQKMHDCKVTPAMASVIKLARSQRIPYSWITGYYVGLNFGRIADVMKGRLHPKVPPAVTLPPDFPKSV